MGSRSTFKKLIAQLVVIVPFLNTSCGQVKAGSSSVPCQANGTAIVEVFDGAMERLCGCQESSNTSFGASGLQCTVTHGMTLVFLFPSIQTQHQIQMPYYGGTSGWSGMVRSSTGGLNQSDSIVLNSTGTFNFTDNYGGLSGTIIVQ